MTAFLFNLLGRKMSASSPPPRHPSGMNGRKGDEDDQPVSPPKVSPSSREMKHYPPSPNKDQNDEDEDEDQIPNPRSGLQNDPKRPKEAISPVPSKDAPMSSPRSSSPSGPASSGPSALDLTPRNNLLFPGFPGLLPSPAAGFSNQILAAAAAASGGSGVPTSPALSQLNAFA